MAFPASSPTMGLQGVGSVFENAQYIHRHLTIHTVVKVCL